MTQHKLTDFFEENYSSFKVYLKNRFHQLNEYDAEDIVQQTILKLLYRDTGGISNLSAYMYTALSNSAVDYFRKNARIELHEDTSTYFHETAGSAEDALLLKELKLKIKETIFSLDIKSRYVFIETELKGRSYESLAKETGERVGTLLSRKSRARKKLQNALEEYIRRNDL